MHYFLEFVFDLKEEKERFSFLLSCFVRSSLEERRLLLYLFIGD
jgi:hypothetical protein